MDDLCTTCLCSGRNLSFLEDTGCYHIYLQILNEIQMPEVSVRVCWECRALLRRFHHFRLQVRRCQLLLSEEGTPKYALCQPPRLRALPAAAHSFPPADVKLENGDENVELIHDIKVETEDAEHREPETFVNDLELEKSEELKQPVKKKKKKLKGGKRKKKKTEELSDGFSDRDVIDDNIPCDSKEEIESICSTCGLTFENRETMDRHVQEEHVKEILVKVVKAVRPRSKEVLDEKPTCAECGKVFSSRKTYRYHLNVLHKGQNRYPCPRCGKVYQWKSNLGRHLRTHKGCCRCRFLDFRGCGCEYFEAHFRGCGCGCGSQARDDGELYCALCDKRFASVATYRQHLRVSRRHVSESEFSFVCNECGKKFVNKTRLRDHVDWEHLKKIKFRCQLCDKPFKCHTSLYVHLQNVHRNKEKKDNLCHVCGKSYQNAAKLKYHIVAMHTRETPYQCGQCGASFGWYSSLYRHIREVHYKMKTVQTKKSKKGKKLEEMVPMPRPGPA